MRIYNVKRIVRPDGMLLVSMKKDVFDAFISNTLKGHEDLDVYVLKGRRYIFLGGDIPAIYEEVDDGEELC